MTADLFTRLYAYRQRAMRDPLEDWLTECLAATLRSLPRDMLVSTLTALVRRPKADINQLVSDHVLAITTQYVVPGIGRPDLVVLLDGSPWIVFENKIGHTVDDQLDRYARWLAARDDEHLIWRCLAFVTHFSAPPQHFGELDWAQRYGSRILPRTTTWGRLARQLLSIVSSDRGDSLSRALVESFHAMLESKQMADDYPTSQAFASLELFIANGGAVQNLVERMWEQVCHAANSKNMAERRVEAWPNHGCYGAWRYVQKTSKHGEPFSWLETGVWFADLARWRSAESGEPISGTNVYIFYGNDLVPAFNNIVGAPPGWFRPDGSFLCYTSLHEFPYGPDERATAVLAWSKQRAGELREFLLAQELVKF